MGRYRFVIDLDGHIDDERVADALLGLRRFSPKVTFLGSYPRANGHRPEVSARYTDEAFVEARAWLERLKSGSPEQA
jgi:prephenate dehydratase